MTEDTAVMYWSHRKSAFNFLTEEDQTMYLREPKDLRCGSRDNRIFVIQAGGELEITGVIFYPLLFEFNGPICPEYRMLCGSGLFGDAAHPSYLLTPKKARKNALTYLTKPRKAN